MEPDHTPDNPFVDQEQVSVTESESVQAETDEEPSLVVEEEPEEL